MGSENNKIIGNGGEDYAAVFLESRGYDILARGWRVGHLELDIVAMDRINHTLRVVEVKSRVVECGNFGSRCAALGLGKLSDGFGKLDCCVMEDVVSDFSAKRAMSTTKARRVMEAGRRFAEQVLGEDDCELALDLVTVEFVGCRVFGSAMEVLDDSGRTKCDPRIVHYPDIHWEFL